MGPWYRQLGRGDGSAVVDDTPWVARGHGRETTFQQNIVERGEIEEAARELLAQVLEDVAAEGRPVVGVGLKVRYAPFLTKTFTQKIPTTFDRGTRGREIMELVAKIEPDRPLRLLGVRAEMAMPDDARRATRRPAAAGDPGTSAARSQRRRGRRRPARRRRPRASSSCVVELRQRTPTG